jgi:hypothetical protein
MHFVEGGAVIAHQLAIGQIDFAHHHAVAVLVEKGAHLADDVVHLRLILRVDVLEPVVRIDAIPIRIDWLVTQAGILDHQPDHIDAEAINAAIEPEAHLVEHCRQHFWVAVVEFGLLLDELMQIVLTGLFVKSPCRAAKETCPVIGRAAVGRRVAPDVPVALRVIAAAAALLKPGMFV